MAAMAPDVRARALSAVDESEAVSLLRRAIQVPSVTRDERAFAEFIAEELRASGLDQVELFDFAPGRPNVWGVLRGSGGGKRLMVLGHLDTVHAEGWEQQWSGTPAASPFAGAELDGDIVGRGAGDQKAGLVTTIAAIRALGRAGIQLAGDVIVVAVGDEESGEPDSGYSQG